MRFAAFLLLAGSCFAEQQQKPQTKKMPQPDPITAEQVAAQVSALLKPSDDPAAWCKTPTIGLVLAPVSIEMPKPKPTPSARRD